MANRRVEKRILNRQNIAYFVASFTRVLFRRNRSSYEWCQALDAVAEKLVMFCVDSPEFTLALSRTTGPEVLQLRLLRMDMRADGTPDMDSVTVLADTHWVTPDDYDAVSQVLEEVVFAAAYATLSDQELKARVVPSPKDESR